MRKEENQSIDENEKIEKKKYMNNKEIQDETIDIKNIIFDLEEVYNNNISNIINNFNNSKINNTYDMSENYKKKIKEEYITFIKLLIKVNTNKKLLIQYLHFLKENENILIKIKDLYIEYYKDELEYYKVMFNKDEFLKYFKKKKF